MGGVTTAPYQLLPVLTYEEYQALKDDIAARGVQVPIEVDEEGNAMIVCRSCGAPIRWDKSAKTGKPVPISLATGLSHFADCPNAKDWSRKKDSPPGPRAVFVRGSGWILRP